MWFSCLKYVTSRKTNCYVDANRSLASRCQWSGASRLQCSFTPVSYKMNPIPFPLPFLLPFPGDQKGDQKGGPFGAQKGTLLGTKRGPFWCPIGDPFGPPFDPFGASKGVQKGPHPNRKRQGYPLCFAISIDFHRFELTIVSPNRWKSMETVNVEN